MSKKLVAALPPDFDLPFGFRIRLTTVDATTGAIVAGVTVSNVAIMAASIVPATAESAGGIADVAPLFTPVPVE